jgi:glycine cleavage system regulatory protein
MSTAIVFTVVGDDKPGLVDQLAHTVARHGGNWLESRMSQLAGRFAGIVHVAVAEPQLPALRAALQALCSDALTVVVVTGKHDAAAQACRLMQLRIVGNDRPGIVREVAGALAGRGINLRELDTSITSAPMSGDALFTATAQIEIPMALDVAALQRQLDAIADALTIDIDLEQAQP